jgi:ABC-type transporter Mla subunit MlaD
MYTIEIDKEKRFLVISAIGHVSKDEVKAAAEKVRELVEDAPPGLHTLTDLRWLNTMEADAATYVAEIMKALQEKQLAFVTRIIPDASKDIGFNILSHFHYKPNVQIFTVQSLAEALRNIEELSSSAGE